MCFLVNVCFLGALDKKIWIKILYSQNKEKTHIKSTNILKVLSLCIVESKSHKTLKRYYFNILTENKLNMIGF